jgi:arginine decarboxylase
LTDFLALSSEQKKSAKKPALTETHNQVASAPPLTAAVSRHSDYEIASFHTPGHKGRALSAGFAQLQERFLRRDLTELPGLDDLTVPEGAIAQIESRASSLWGSAGTLISVGGASAGLIASLLALASCDQRKKIFVPRNAHRSVINGLVLSGLVPVWYEPVWDVEWGIWGEVTSQSIEYLFKSSDIGECSALLLVSPTYAGALSDMHSIAQKCIKYGIALVVDEAHGAHLLPECDLPPSAAPYADITVQSLHKTLSGFTQTGLVHVGSRSRVPLAQIRAAMNLIHSSSPSYPLMMSVEQTIALLESMAGRQLIHQLISLSANAVERIAASDSFACYQPHSGADPAHILIRPTNADAEQLNQFLQQHRIFAEASLGNGLLLMLGIGSTEEDVDALFDALKQFVLAYPMQVRATPAPAPARFPDVEQVLSPREAFVMPSDLVSIQEAVGRIAQECVAPCPPGVPIIVPGQRVHKEVMNIESFKALRTLKVVKQEVSPTE